MTTKFDPNCPRPIPQIAPITGLGEHRQFNSIQLGITTHCNRMCPGCCCNMPYLSKYEHMDPDWIQEISQKLQGLRLLQISGGEPTIHPQFQYITENIREWFNPQMLMLITNGKRIVRYADILGHYDHIRISRYNASSYPGSPSNEDTIAEFQRVFKGPSMVWSKLAKHWLGRGKEGGLPCGLGANDLAIIQWKKIYPCCAAPGQDPLIGIELTDNWREDLKTIELPCNNCPFSSTEEGFRAWSQRLRKEQEKYKQSFKAHEIALHRRIEKEGYNKWHQELKDKGIDMSIVPGESKWESHSDIKRSFDSSGRAYDVRIQFLQASIC